MSDQQLCHLSIAEQARLIRNREISPVELLESVLRQIERVDPAVNSYITVPAEEARAATREAEQEIGRGDYRGPLHGIPIALKDLYYTRGIRTTAGSKIHRDFVPTKDAEVVVRLKKAGSVLVGKTNMHEFALGAINTNPHFGDVHNPWDLERISGGSSGGSAAAVAASMASAALGSDTGGSIRIPASLCGVVGLKPTYGRVSRHGAMPCAWSLDHVGPLCKTAEDAALLLQVIAGRDPKDPTSSHETVPDYAAGLSQGISGLRLAVLKEHIDPETTQPAVLAGFQAAIEVLRGLGATIEELSVPEAIHAYPASTAILSVEAAAYHECDLRVRPEEIGPDVRARLEGGLLIAATDYVKAQRVRRMLAERFVALLRQYDAILGPAEPTTAPRIDQETIQYPGLAEARRLSLTRYTRLHNVTGLPAASVPMGFDSSELPMGLQIACAPFDEEMVLRIGHAYQQATNWHKRLPPAAAG